MPIIPVTLITAGHIILDAMVDSGATYTLFEADFGRIIGLDIEKGKEQELSGAGGATFTVYFHNIKLQIGDITFPCYAGFSDSLKLKACNGLLGQNGFFDKFKVEFNIKNSVMNFELF